MRASSLRQVLLLLPTLTVLVLMAGEAKAHVGHDGDIAVLRAPDVRAVAVPGGVRLAVRVIDAFTGAPAPGFRVVVGPSARVEGAAKPLKDLGDGWYVGVLPLPSGRWDVVVRIGTYPGGEPARPVERVVTVKVGGSTNDVPAPEADHRSAPGVRWRAIGVVASVLLAGVLGLFWSRRR